MKRAAVLALGAAVVACAVSSATLSCSSSAGAPVAPSPCGASLATHAKGAAWQPSADPASPVAATFTVTVDPKSPALASMWQEPHPEALAISGGGAGLRLVGGAKTFARHPERVGNFLGSQRAIGEIKQRLDLGDGPIDAPLSPHVAPAQDELLHGGGQALRMLCYF